MTLNDVAKISGYSVATVSKVFKNSAEISVETKKKVIKAAERVGYIKKATTRPALLGGVKPVILADATGRYAYLVKELSKTAERKGLCLVYTLLNTKKALELSSQIGAWGVVTTEETNDSAENLFVFSEDMNTLAEALEQFAAFVPKRAPRTKAPGTGKRANSVKETKTEVKRKDEDIWLL